MTIDLRNHHKAPSQQPVRAHDAPPVREETYAPKARVSPRRGRERMIMTLAAGATALIVVVLLGYGVSKAWSYLSAGSEAELRAVVSDVSDLMLLPSDETPTLATVSDMHALEGQEFFKKAQEGDKVLMYLRSRRAIIYRPSIDKIIEVGPITGDVE